MYMGWDCRCKNSGCKGSEDGTAPLYFRVKSDCHLNYQFGFRLRQTGSCSVNIQRRYTAGMETPSVGNQITLLILHMLTCFEGSRFTHAHESILLCQFSTRSTHLHTVMLFWAEKCKPMLCGLRIIQQQEEQRNSCPKPGRELYRCCSVKCRSVCPLPKPPK